VARISAEGRLDDSFGGGLLAPIELANSEFADDVVGVGPAPLVLPDGRIRVPTQVELPIGPNYRLALVGLTANGHPDRRFGIHGLALAPLPTVATSEQSYAAVRDSSGSIIMAASAWDPAEGPYGSDIPILRRFRRNGRIDRSFGSDGLVHDPSFQPDYDITKQTLAMLDKDTLIAADHNFESRGFAWGPARLRLLHAGHDRARPSISLRTSGCRSLAVRIRDLSRMDRVVVRAGRRVVRRTNRQRFRVRVRQGGRRITVRATDLAENSSSRRVRLPRC
jgi:hypothetical protein